MPTEMAHHRRQAGCSEGTVTKITSPTYPVYTTPLEERGGERLKPSHSCAARPERRLYERLPNKEFSESAERNCGQKTLRQKPEQKNLNICAD